MASHPNYFWMVLLGTPGSKRLKTLGTASILCSALFFGLAHLYYLESTPSEYLSKGHHRSLSAIVFALGFFGTVRLVVEWIGAEFFLSERDFQFEDGPWKQRVRDLFLLKLGSSKSLIALAFGLIILVIFDYSLAGKLYGSFIGQTARVLADLFILLTSMGLSAALFLRKQ